jgi:hypothetical protein
VLPGVLIARRRQVSQVRREARMRPVRLLATVRAQVETSLFGELAIRGPVTLIVRDGFVEISHPFPVARFLFGQEYYLRLDGMTIEASRGAWGGGWITMEGDCAGRTRCISIANREKLWAIWNALADGGATPIGPPPGPPRSA